MIAGQAATAANMSPATNTDFVMARKKTVLRLIKPPLRRSKKFERLGEGWS